MIGILQNGFNNLTLMYIVAFLFAITAGITIHEFSHGLVAYYQGDNTAKLSGRLTLNPFAHFDALGFISLLCFGFGWAKPVPINSLKFKEYNKGIFLTSIAGIVANFFLAFFSAGGLVLCNKILYLTSGFGEFVVEFLIMFFNYSLVINLSLALFNLLPIPPLDGYNLVMSLSKKQNKFLTFVQRYGQIILLVLIISSALSFILEYVLGFIIVPFINFWECVI